MTNTVAVVGGGPAGTAAAFALRDADAAVTLYEAESTLGGRMRTRRRGDCRYDAGANYVTADDDRVNAAMAAAGTEGRADVAAPVWTFGADGEVSPGRGDGDPKWTYAAGVAELPRRFAEESGATLRCGRRVRALDRTDDEWTVHTADGDTAAFDAVVLATPAPAVAALLRRSEWSAPLRDRIADTADAIDYRLVVTAALHYPVRVERPYYALLDVDKAHAVGWIGRESCKPGHVPTGESLLVVQMGNDWSAAHLDDDDEAIADAAASNAASLMDDERLADPDWTEVTRWRHALPEDEAPADLVADARAAGLHLVGDWVAGAARVHAAARTGLAAGRRLSP
ncbi:MAG: NAD(P)/FAD-dependent oxidoreductase [Halobacteriaceae archaeon]